MTRLFVLLLTAVSLRAAVVSNYQLYSTNLSKQMDVSMMVPNEYADSTSKQYPVLYCLHGSNSPYTTYTSMSVMKAQIDGPYPMIIVTYGADNSMYAGGHQPWFFDELVPYIESNYRVLADSTKRAVTGFSMGGYGSFLFLSLRPGFFSSVISLSGVFYGGIYDSLANMKTSGTPFPGLMVDCGTADALLYHSEAMRDFLTTNGIVHTYGEVLGGAHDYTYWNNRSDVVAAFAWRYFDDVPPNAPTGLSGTPTEHTVALTWTAPSAPADGDTVAGYAVYRDDTLVTRVTGESFTDTDLPPERGFTYTVYTLDDADHQSASGVSVTVTTTVDNAAPVVLEVISQGLTETAVYFDEDIDAVSAAAAGNYTLDGGVTVSAAVVDGDRKVVLTTSVQGDETEYTLSVAGVADVSPAATRINPAQEITFTALATFYDDFESGFRSCWQPAGTATWAIASGNGGNVMSITDSPTDILLLDRTYGTFTLDAAVQAPDASSYRHVKIVFGHTDSLSYFDVDFAGARHASYNGIFQTAAGTATKLMGDNVEATITDETAWYNIRVEVDAEAKTVKGYCGDYDTPVFYTDIPDYTGGKIGLWSHRGKYGNFDDIIITQYVRTGTWAPVDDNPVLHTVPSGPVPNPATLPGLRAAGWEVRTLSGKRPDDSYRGVVILLNGKDTVVRQLILTD